MKVVSALLYQCFDNEPGVICKHSNIAEQAIHIGYSTTKSGISNLYYEWTYYNQFVLWKVLFMQEVATLCHTVNISRQLREKVMQAPIKSQPSSASIPV